MERIFQASPFRRNLTQFPDFIWGRTTLLFYNPDPVNVCMRESPKITRCDPVPEDASLEVDVVMAGAGCAVVAVLVWLSDHTHAPTGASSLRLCLQFYSASAASRPRLESLVMEN